MDLFRLRVSLYIYLMLVVSEPPSLSAGVASHYVPLSYTNLDPSLYTSLSTPPMPKENEDRLMSVGELGLSIKVIVKSVGLLLLLVTDHSQEHLGTRPAGQWR